jgi:hypothetical protein
MRSLLDKIEDQSGPRQADVVLAVVRKAMNWYAAVGLHPSDAEAMTRRAVPH